MFRLEAIEPNLRLVIDGRVIEELCLSISRHGQREPILIHQQNMSFKITDGEKRWRAIKKNGQPTIIAELEK